MHASHNAKDWAKSRGRTTHTWLDGSGKFVIGASNAALVSDEAVICDDLQHVSCVELDWLIALRIYPINKKK